MWGILDCDGIPRLSGFLFRFEVHLDGTRRSGKVLCIVQ